MQSEIASWPAAIVEIAKYFVPAAITAIVSILISRYQWKTKEVGVRGQAELKARELLFNSYQKRIERIGDFAKGSGEALGRLMPHIKEIREEEESLALAIIEIVRMSIAPYRVSLEELENELSKANIIDEKQTEVSFIKETLATQPDSITTENIGPIYLNFVKALALIHSLREDLLSKKCEDLFRPYVDRV